MICPQCDAEYREGFTSCSTCNVPLIPGTKPNEYRQQGATTPALIAGLLIGVFAGVVYIFRAINEPIGWYVLGVLVALGAVAYFIRSKYRV